MLLLMTKKNYFIPQLQKIEMKLKTFGDEDKLKEYQTIFDEIKQLNRVSPKVNSINSKI